MTSTISKLYTSHPKDEGCVRQIIVLLLIFLKEDDNRQLAVVHKQQPFKRKAKDK